MFLTLAVLSYDDAPPTAPREARFGEAGGTVGRRADRTLSLEDPERIVSGDHARISFENGQFVITDTSTNGTYVNESAAPLGKGNAAALANGDTLKIGRYLIAVAIGQEAAEPAAEPVIGPSAQVSSHIPADFGLESGDEEAPSLDSLIESNPLPADEPRREPALGGGGGPPDTENPLMGGRIEPPSGGLIPSDGDAEPGGLIPSDDAPARNLIPDDLERGTSDREAGETDDSWAQSDNASLLSSAFQAPRPVRDEPPALVPDGAADIGPNAPSGGIPSDWNVEDEPGGDAEIGPIGAPEPASIDDETPGPGAVIGDDFAEPSAAEPIPAPEPARPVAAPPRPAPQPVSAVEPPPAPVPAVAAAPQDLAGNALAAILRAAGLGEVDLGRTPPQAVAENIGEILREAIGGIVDALRDRTDFKVEFRLDVTRIQPTENNPLKFSTTIEDVARQLLTESRPGLMGPGEAFNEAFGDLRVHHLATMIGLKACLTALLKRLDPAEIEAESQKRSSVLSSRRAQCWEIFLEHFQDIQADADDGFRRLLADEFARAYDEQEERMRRARFQRET